MDTTAKTLPEIGIVTELIMSYLGLLKREEIIRVPLKFLIF
jgi:hypothetical protein